MPIPPRHLYAHSEQCRQPLYLQDFFFGPVSHDLPSVHENYASNLRDNICQFMCHQNDRRTRLGQDAHGVSHAVLG
jgi:hypothetical protein